MVYNVFQLLRHLKKVPLPVGASTSHVMHVPWTRPIQHPKLHLDRFSCFWATVYKTVRPMLSDRCLSCLSVCL